VAILARLSRDFSVRTLAGLVALLGALLVVADATGLVVAAPDPCANPGGDLDRDGLPNGWECGPVKLPEGRLNLKRLGAKPDRRDIFIECDYMKTAAKDLQPTQQALDQVAGMFANAPLRNPDGSWGITLHIDAGRHSVNVPAGAPRKGNRIPYEVRWPQYPFGKFYRVKAKHFVPVRNRAFHYCVFASAYGKTGSSGIAFIRGNDFIVTLGDEGWVPGSDAMWSFWQASTLAHELGHNLGLEHGGPDSYNHKPNYLSVMNYAYQLDGLIKDGELGTMDYARTRAADLNERRLVEKKGIAGPKLLARYGTQWVCPDSSVPTDTNVLDGIDWNCDGDLDDTVSQNINGDIGAQDEPLLMRLEVWNDWKNLFYPGGPIGTDSETPVRTSGPEITAEDLRAWKARFAQRE